MRYRTSGYRFGRIASTYENINCVGKEKRRWEEEDKKGKEKGRKNRRNCMGGEGV
jgi:hypothetical protein